ncbi:MAG: hypothetical protein ABGY75_00700, partial [Gemmataceae bacterium]
MRRMFVVRIAVAIYLVLATAVGPWPCCCAQPGSACRTVGPESTGSNGPPSCCHAGKTRPVKLSSAGAARLAAAAERPAGGQNLPACPCGDHGCAAKVRPDQARPVTSHAQTPEPADAGGVFAAFVPPAAAVLAGTSGDHRAVLSVADRLNGHRVLRC